MASKITETRRIESIYLDDGTYIREEESIYIDSPITVDIWKANVEEQMVFGWANVAVNKDGTIPLDWQGDIIPPEILEKAAYGFVLDYRDSGEMHVGDTTGHLVESVMFTKQKRESMSIPEGILPDGWWVGFYIPDKEVVQKIKDGKYKMFSIQGKAIKV